MANILLTFRLNPLKIGDERSTGLFHIVNFKYLIILLA